MATSFILHSDLTRKIQLKDPEDNAVFVLSSNFQLLFLNTFKDHDSEIVQLQHCFFYFYENFVLLFLIALN